jgi:hypothetical protein
VTPHLKALMPPPLSPHRRALARASDGEFRCTVVIVQQAAPKGNAISWYDCAVAPQNFQL